MFSCCCANVDRTWSPVCGCYLGGFDCDQNCLEDNVDKEDLYYEITLVIICIFYRILILVFIDLFFFLTIQFKIYFIRDLSRVFTTIIPIHIYG